MSVYALSADGKESWKMIQDPRKNPCRHKIDSSVGNDSLLRKTSLKSVHNFLRCFAHTYKDTQTHVDAQNETST